VSTDPAALERATLRRVSRRLLPFLFLLFIANYLDRVNVSFAALHMNRDLGFSGAVYGLGAGMFFLGYCLFQLPSNLLLARVGARRWIAALTVLWGLIASAMMFVQGRSSFYALRFLLGVIEAGFFPGMILYLTYWFPGPMRARAVARFMTAIPAAQIVGGPLSGWLLERNGLGGLAGWQWLFLLEGLPSIALGVVTWFFLTDRPEQAGWLDADAREWLRGAVGRPADATAGTPARRLLRSAVLWQLAVVWFLMVVVGYGQLLWLPQIIKGASATSDLTVGVLSTLPPLAATVAMLAVAARSDRTGRHRRFVTLTALITAAGFGLTALALRVPLLATGGLTIVAIGIAGSFGPFWGVATGALGSAGAAAGIALVNSIGNIGGFAGPTIVGVAKDATGSFAGVLWSFALLAALAGVLAARVGSTVPPPPSRTDGS
jgi:MFS transporter, ACS family, tartrate transporter